MGSNIRLQPAGDSALVVELGSQINPLINRQVHYLAKLLMQAPLQGIGEAVPAYASLMVNYDPAILDYQVVARWVENCAAHLDTSPAPEPRQVEIPTVYGGSYGPDLVYVAEFHHLHPQEVIQLHSNTVYTVFMLGFLPGFAYLGGLPDDLATPRLDKPRQLVTAGSVGIAASQTGIYPIDSPGGWRIIGFTPLRLFDPHHDPPTLLTAGDQVRFIPISPRELADAFEGA